MYCVRPVIVNVPTGEWFCSRCKRGREDDKKPFSAFLAELEKGPNEAIKFLHLSYNEPNEFYSAHKEGLELFSPDTKPTTRRQILGTSKSTATACVGSINFSWWVYNIFYGYGGLQLYDAMCLRGIPAHLCIFHTFILTYFTRIHAPF